MASTFSFGLAGCADENHSAERLFQQDVELTDYPENIYWGDLHLHTRYSFDSYTFGNENLSPDDAYRFARGEAVEAHTGDEAQLSRPLDFLMVSDHSEYLGVFAAFRENDPRLANSDFGRRWGPVAEAGNSSDVIGEMIQMINGNAPRQEPSEEFRASAWAEIVAAAERHNEPGVFTTFAGYEWTAMSEGGNQHRVVVYRDGPERTLRTIPFSSVASNDPMDLWRYLERYESATGGEAIAIAHNGNVSNGNMFGFEQFDGRPLTEEYVRMRARWEPLYEVTQVKGDGEAHTLLSPDDEFADFETWDDTNIAMVERSEDPDVRREIVRGDYAREGLKQGLELIERFEINPYQFGLIGSTDSHTALATADDDNFWGKFVDSEPTEERLGSRMGGALWENWRLTSSGYVGVWSRANTRDALFSAFERREVYATTGPRMTVRFFGGWEFTEGDLNQPDYARTGYREGVPMGGVLAGSGDSPRFMITALKDPDGANLDRVQVIKGWRIADGTLHERVYDVAFGEGRTRDEESGRLRPIGSTINFEDATYTNDIGEVELSTVWTDPDFDPDQPAFYYVRVIEIPTPRWTLYDAVRFGRRPQPEVPLTTQERAYTSPIWYNPA